MERVLCSCERQSSFCTWSGGVKWIPGPIRVCLAVGKPKHSLAFGLSPGKDPSHSTGICRQHQCPGRGLGPCGWDAFTCPMCIPRGALRPGWRRHRYDKRGEAAAADAAASSGIRALNKKSPLPRAGSGHAHIVSSFPAGGISVSGYTLLARVPWASPLGNASSEVLRYRFCSRRTLPETTGLCQALCSHRNVRASCLFSRFSEEPENVFTERARP